MKSFHYTPKTAVLSFLFLSIIAVWGCGGRDKNLTDRKAELGNASWITDNRVYPETDSLLYGDFPSPLFRKEFSVSKPLKSATLYITAAGYYNATINGKKTGKNYLDPAWTNYEKRIYYSEYDLTSDITPGNNCIGITTGNGFYNPLPMKMWGRYNLRESLPVGNPSVIARLKIEYSDGTTEELITDNTWKYSYGPVVKNNVYLGEVYDARREIKGWNEPGFNDSKWTNSIENPGPGGSLLKAFFQPVQVTRTHKPLAVLSPEKGIYIVDMGVNFTGLYRIKLKGEKGDTITFRFGERIYDDGTLNPMTAVCGQIKSRGTGGPGSPDIAWQTDSYIFGDNTEVWYSPEFTFHVYRYMEIAGLKYKPETDDVAGIAFNSNVENINNFTSSSELLNSIQEATRRTFLSNLLSVQSDCPGREKFGYGGDLNATCEAYINNFNMHAFYRKTVYDWVDVMNDTVFVDTAPFVGLNYCGISWESAFITTQYQLYLYYNDTDIIKELYELDLKWMDKAARLHPDGIVDKGLSDHEAIGKVPVELIGTTHYMECARIMKIFAGLMNDSKNERKFEQLSERLKNSVLDFYRGINLKDTLNRQTLFSTLLYYDIIPEDEIKAASDSLLNTVASGPSGHFTTGIFGTKYVLEAMSRTGHAGSVFNIVNSKAYPGWGYMIDRGATTIWETWQESDNIYSNCHPMFGSVSEWFYRWLGGIRPDPAFPGFKKFIIAPCLPDDLTFVNCVYESPFGIIKSNWSKTGKGVKFEITVPAKTTATFIVPVENETKVTIEDIDKKEETTKQVSKNEPALQLNEGSYLIKY